MGKYALYIIISLILAISYASISISRSQVTALNSSAELNGVTEARDAANSYMKVALYTLRTESWSTMPTDGRTYNYTVSRMGKTIGSVQVKAKKMPERGMFAITSKAQVTNRGSKNQTLSYTTTVVEREVSFAKYALFTNSMNANNTNATGWGHNSLGWGSGTSSDRVNFAGNQRINGDVHVNNTLNIANINGAEPQFYGNVTAKNVSYIDQANRALNIANFTGFHGTSNLNYRGSEDPTSFFLESGLPLYTAFQSTTESNLNSTFAEFPGFRTLWNANAKTNDVNFQDWVTKFDEMRYSYYNAYSTRYVTVVGSNLVVSPVPEGFPGYDQIKRIIPVADVNSAGGIFYCKGDIHLKGNLDGKLTIASEGKVYIDGDVTYAGYNAAAADPLANCDDMLGIMSKQGVEVSTDYKYFAAGTTPTTRNSGWGWNDWTIESKGVYNPSNVKLMASLYTQTGLTTQNINNADWLGDRGNLDLYGGLTCSDYGARGMTRTSTSGWSGQTSTNQYGYATNYNYDKRFKQTIPPGLPFIKITDDTGNVRTKKEIVSWKERL